MHTSRPLLAEAGQARNRARKLALLGKGLSVPLLAAMVLAAGTTARAAGSLAVGEAVVLKASSEGIVLAKSCPRGDFEIEFEVACNQTGAVWREVWYNGC